MRGYELADRAGYPETGSYVCLGLRAASSHSGHAGLPRPKPHRHRPCCRPRTAADGRHRLFLRAHHEGQRSAARLAHHDHGALTGLVFGQPAVAAIGLAALLPNRAADIAAGDLDMARDGAVLVGGRRPCNQSTMSRCSWRRASTGGRGGRAVRRGAGSTPLPSPPAVPAAGRRRRAGSARCARRACGRRSCGRGRRRWRGCRRRRTGRPRCRRRPFPGGRRR